MLKVSNYSVLSFFYDRLMQGIDYSGWSQYIFDLTKEFSINYNSALELGSGNCKIAENIAQKFSFFIASDLSLPMLKTHRKNNVNSVCCNMINLPFNTKFDFIFASFDTINYLVNESQLLRLFREIENLLVDNGIFTFDVGMSKNSRKLLKKLNREGEFDGYFFIQKSEFDEERLIHTNEFEIKHNNEIYREVHKQKIYDFFTYFELLDRTGLYVALCFNAFTFVDGDEDSERLQFVLRKRQ